MKSSNKVLIGRHCLVRNPYYLPGAVEEALSYSANSLMIYLGAPQNSFRQPLEILKVSSFKKILKNNNLDIKNVIVHGSYLINLANTLNQKVFDYSVRLLREEIKRIEKIGLKFIVLHPGSSSGVNFEKACLQIAKGLNLVLEKNHKIFIALETMSGKGNELGVNFNQLKLIIDNVNLKQKVGICWDTCHLYSAGYDIKKNLEKIIKEFDEIIGLNKLWVIHLNDSIFPLDSKKDRHENIGYGQIGWKALKKIVHHPQFKNIPKLLETPRKRESFKEEIKRLIRK